LDLIKIGESGRHSLAEKLKNESEFHREKLSKSTIFVSDMDAPKNTDKIDKMFNTISKKDQNMTQTMMNKTHTGFVSKFRTHSSLNNSGVRPFQNKKVKKGDLIKSPNVKNYVQSPQAPKIEPDGIYKSVKSNNKTHISPLTGFGQLPKFRSTFQATSSNTQRMTNLDRTSPDPRNLKEMSETIFGNT